MHSSAINDSQTVTKPEVEVIVRKMCVSYAHLRRSFIPQQKHINQCLDQGDVVGAVRGLLFVFRIPHDFTKRIGFNAKGLPPQALAAMQMLTYGKKPPVSGTMLFAQPKVEVLQNPRYRLIHMMAHELSHARMFLDGHELAHSEFATDVLALLVTGNTKEFSENMSSFLGRYGYIRLDLYETVFHCLNKHAETIYM